MDKTCRKCGQTLPPDQFECQRATCKPCRFAQSSDWHKAHPDKRKIYSAKWSAANASLKARLSREWRVAHREEVRGYKRDWAAEHPEAITLYNRQARLQRRARLARVASELVDPREVYRRSGGICGICGAAVSVETFHVDHIIPISRGGPHVYANTQAAHPLCNIRKNARVAA